jgi:RNA polymerase sigma-70 factor, ECF subfamily
LIDRRWWIDGRRVLSHSGHLAQVAARGLQAAAPVRPEEPEQAGPAALPDALDERATVSPAEGAAREPMPPREVLMAVTPAVWRVLRRTGVMGDELDDSLQNVLVQLCRRWAQLQALPAEELRAYACCAAAGVATDVARRRGRERTRLRPLEVEPADPRLGADAALERKEARASLDRILAAMPEERRVVFVLYELEELAAPQIAEHLEVPLGTVASRLRKARQDFQSAVQRLRARQGQERTPR